VSASGRQFHLGPRRRPSSQRSLRDSRRLSKAAETGVQTYEIARSQLAVDAEVEEGEFSQPPPTSVLNGRGDLDPLRPPAAPARMERL